MKETPILNENLYTVENFNTLYTRYQTLVGQQITKLHIYRDHDDYFQEGMYAIVQALKTMDPYHPNQLAYLTQHVRRRLIDKLRRESRLTTPIIFTDDQTKFDYGTYEAYECELLDFFDPEDQTLIHFILKGYSTTEIAKKLGISIRTVQRRLRKYQGKFGVNEFK
ncbi:MAG: sigma-70 family RNA polymerase sigma factor [Culicoidibacterales bacterium]